MEQEPEDVVLDRLLTDAEQSIYRDKDSLSLDVLIRLFNLFEPLVTMHRVRGYDYVRATVLLDDIAGFIDERLGIEPGSTF